MTGDHYPNLRYLFANYLHEDWVVEGPSPNAVIAKAIRESPQRIREGVCAEIRAVLTSGRSDEELGALLRDLGAYFDPSLVGHNTRHWLMEVLELGGR